MKKYLSVIFFLSCANLLYAQKKHTMYIGTYTATGSHGIYMYGFSSGADYTLVDSVKASNPSFLAISADRSMLYAVSENVEGGIVYFSINKQNNRLSENRFAGSEGKHPCYVAVDKTGQWIAAGNYSSGNFVILPGKGGKPAAIVQHEGKSRDVKRQSSAHVHATVFSPDNRFLLVTDLGTDKIMVYAFDQLTGAVRLALEQPIEAGSGPRHLAFHPTKDYLYLLNELTGTVNVFRYHTKNGSLFLLQTISSVEAGFKGFAGSADIHLSADGKFLYASNRGDANNIAIYKVNKKNGLLTLIGHQPVLGKAPRNFSIDPSGKYLLCANQDSNEIVIFNRNRRTGLLTDSRKRIAVPRPVNITWLPGKK